jgi:hypothetical protein
MTEEELLQELRQAYEKQNTASGNADGDSM